MDDHDRRRARDPEPAGHPAVRLTADAVDLRPLAAVAVTLLLAWALVVALLWLLRPRGVPLRSLVAVVPDVLRLLRSLLTDPSVPLDVRLVIVALVAWLVSPIDLIPEIVPVLGPFDDVVVAVVALRYVRRRLGAEELRRRWPGDEAGFEVLARVVGSG
jgi:uncharacterized membrane protein YkvA (DUF1232 family)